MLFLKIVFISLSISAAVCNKYSSEKNAEYQKLMNIDKPFRMQKLNLVWEKAIKKMSPEKLKLLFTDLKYQDKEELNWKAEKAKGLDKNGLKEAIIQGTFKAILEKYHLWQDYTALEESVLRTGRQEFPKDAFEKAVFKDKKLNKLWLKAEQQGFSEDELRMLKEEFHHHQNKIDQYYQILNQLHKVESNDERINAVEHFLSLEEGEKMWKSENPHQVLKEKHADLKRGYDYLNERIFPGSRRDDLEFEEPQVNALWERAKNASFTPEELDSLKNELRHFEHRIKKLKVLSASDNNEDNFVNEDSLKRQKKLKDYNYKVEKVHKDLSSRILQRHSEL